MVWNLILVILWGFIFGFIPVGWSTWITRNLAEHAEMAGSLSVAAIQLSIGLAAATGGGMFDHFGMHGIFIIASLILLCAVVSTKASFSLLTKSTGRLA